MTTQLSVVQWKGVKVMSQFRTVASVKVDRSHRQLLATSASRRLSVTSRKRTAVGKSVRRQVSPAPDFKKAFHRSLPPGVCVCRREHGVPTRTLENAQASKATCPMRLCRANRLNGRSWSRLAVAFPVVLALTILTLFVVAVPEGAVVFSLVVSAVHSFGDPAMIGIMTTGVLVFLIALRILVLDLI